MGSIVKSLIDEDKRKQQWTLDPVIIEQLVYTAVQASEFWPHIPK
jgi:hypothetical protein